MTYVPENARISSGNSSTATLTAGATFTGTWEDVGLAGSVIVAVSTDQDGYAEVQFSTDGTNADSTLTRYYRTAEINAPSRFTITRRYVRVKFTNSSASNQTYLRLQTMYGDKPDLNIPTDAVMSQRYDAISVRPTDYFTEVGLGRRQNQTAWNKWGYNSDVDAAAQETVWSAGGLWTPMTASQTLSVVSSSANDTAAGTGARTITIFGINGTTKKAQTEVVTLNGTTPVTTSLSYIYGLNRISLATAGSGGVNAGNITVTGSTSLTTQAYMPAGAGATQQALFCVQTGHTALADWLWINVNKVSGSSPIVTIKAYYRNFTGGTIAEIFQTVIDTAVENTVQLTPSQPFAIAGDGALEFRASTDTNNTIVNLRFSLVEHKNVSA